MQKTSKVPCAFGCYINTSADSILVSPAFHPDWEGWLWVKEILGSTWK